MKYIMNLRIIIVCAALLSLVACNEDKGNYDYKAINQVDDITGIEESYSVEIGEQLKITPEFDPTMGHEDDLDYTWYYRNGTEWSVLQEGRNFDFEIAAPIGTPYKTYTCAFEVKNRLTGVAYRDIFSIKVAGTFNKGYVLVYEKENEFDMGMIVHNTQNQFIPKYDILASTAPSLQREGVKPYGINIFDDATAPNPYKPDGSKRSMYLLTDHYTTRLKVGDFSWDASYDVSNSVESNSPIYDDYVAAGRPIIAEKMKTGYFISSNIVRPNTYIYVKNDKGEGNWYLHKIFPVYYFFSFPMNAYRTGSTVYDSERYEPAPFLACSPRLNMFYDQKEKRFNCQTTYRSSADFSTGFFFTDKVVDESTDHIFSFNDENEGLLYMSERYTNISKMTSFALLKQADGKVKYIEFGSPTSITLLVGKENKLRKCMFDASTGIARAKFIAAAPEPNNAFIYYATDDNKVYYADISSSNAVVREITDKVVPEGYSEITSLKFLIPSTSSKNLAIATYNSSLGDEGGRIDFYKMPSISSGDLELATHKVTDDETIDMSWKGFGKIVGVDYK
ncbi:PKD-like family lipoprotein [Bacteroides sp. 224]|uniref:PKD-like family lipoprotein n=1 Tax=Bacteroides sp. 224 TaxID=2302936 RepID=UPI0013D282B7|nr:PKD-like family lipoprotein [Bacteroides sp. 224]NDV64620.1 hypothetical protein [Bacteroides sp. 224]